VNLRTTDVARSVELMHVVNEYRPGAEFRININPDQARTNAPRLVVASDAADLLARLNPTELPQVWALLAPAPERPLLDVLQDLRELRRVGVRYVGYRLSERALEAEIGLLAQELSTHIHPYPRH
ncbi:MAG: hypothetical protein ACREXT_04325, partial [Gammaproteobacteria bacterium]